MENLLEQEELVDRYVSQGNVEAAVKLLFQLIVRYAQEARDFEKAEALRQRLLEVDANTLVALKEILKAAEIIEAARSESIDRHHLDIWTDLYSTLTKEEANALYYSMSKASYEPEHTLYKQGDMNSMLCFIDHGQMKMVYAQGGHETFLDTLESGDIVGDDGFFSNSVSTTSITSLSPVDLHVLEKGVLQKWQQESPLLEGKLKEYCARSRKVSDLLKTKNLDRRAQKRLSLSGRTFVQLVTPSGVATGNAFKGDLGDISSGGLSFFVRISKKDTARLLLGRRLNVNCVLSLGESQLEINEAGTVVAVSTCPYDDYAVHVRFDKLVDKSVLERIEKCPNPTSLV
jgi:CRP-like cAMP-binding protein